MDCARQIPHIYPNSPTGNQGCPFASVVADSLALNTSTGNVQTRCQFSTGSLHLPPAKRRKVKLHAHVWQECVTPQTNDMDMQQERRYGVCACHMLARVEHMVASARAGVHQSIENYQCKANLLL